jgi:Fe-S cluster biogenesis protein NfuA
VSAQPLVAEAANLIEEDEFIGWAIVLPGLCSTCKSILFTFHHDIEIDFNEALCEDLATRLPET